MNHKGIMRLFEVIDNPTRCHLVMELCQGKNLYQFIRRKLPKYCLTESGAIPVFKQIVQAVNYMHKLGMVHRDLKLENILINDTDNSNEVKIIDFGFATNCKMGSKLSAYCGTPCYMDPDLTKKRKYSG